MSHSEPDDEDALASALHSIRNAIIEDPRGAGRAHDSSPANSQTVDARLDQEDDDLPSIFQPTPNGDRKALSLLQRLTDAVHLARSPQSPADGLRLDRPTDFSTSEGSGHHDTSMAEPGIGRAAPPAASLMAASRDDEDGRGDASTAYRDPDFGRGVPRVMRDLRDSRVVLMSEKAAWAEIGKVMRPATHSDPCKTPGCFGPELPRDALNKKQAPLRQIRPIEPPAGMAGARLPPLSVAHVVRSADRTSVRQLRSLPMASARPMPSASPAPARTPGRALREPPMQPRLPQEADDVTQEVAAELLRPLLRQWLNEHMPRLIGKALHLEADPNPPEHNH